MITISTYATKRYTYALPNFGRRLASSLAYSAEIGGKVLFIGDESEEIKLASQKYIAEQLPSGWDFELIPLPVHDDKLRNYKEDAQLLIAQMQSEALSEARRIRSSHFWSIESDVLVPYNALSVSMDVLNFDNGYYDVAMCTYPSQGGGPFLGGRGTYNRQIEEDIKLSEREVPKEVLKKHKDLQKKISQETEKNKAQELIEEIRDLDEQIKQFPPKGNVYELNGKEWRQRGWMDYAYPAIGKGAIVPTDWVGMGCTLLSEKALAMAHFDGYEGKGTQDLYLGWNRWKPSGLNMCVTTHAICDHVIRKRGEGDEQLWNDFVVVNAYHEPEGIHQGHLRQKHTPLYTFKAGERCQQSVSKE
jgi:hypothetical protein